MSEESAGKSAEAILDELLVLRCRRNDADAWRQLVARWERRLLYYIRRLVSNERDAWDVLQQVWLEVFRKLRSLRDAKALRPWLYRIAYRRAITHLRRDRAEPAPTGGDDAALHELPGRDQPVDLPLQSAEQIHQGLQRLSLTHREVITLFFLEEMPLEEIAQVLEIPAGTVKSRLHYAKPAMRAALERTEAL